MIFLILNESLFMHMRRAGLLSLEATCFFARYAARAFFFLPSPGGPSFFCLIKKTKQKKSRLAAYVAARCRSSGAYLSRPSPLMPPFAS